MRTSPAAAPPPHHAPFARALRPGWRRAREDGTPSLSTISHFTSRSFITPCSNSCRYSTNFHASFSLRNDAFNVSTSCAPRICLCVCMCFIKNVERKRAQFGEALLNIPLIFLVIDFRSGSRKIQTSLQLLISPVCLSTSHISWASFVSAFISGFLCVEFT